MSFAIEVAGRFAREALALGDGEVCAVFRRSFYLRGAGERYACVGDFSLGCGPLNALASQIRLPALGDRVQLGMASAAEWRPAPPPVGRLPGLRALEQAAAGMIPEEGLGCLVTGGENALASHARPALDALNGWLAGNELSDDARALIGLGPGLTPSGDDYLGGMLIGLRSFGAAGRAERLWRWVEPQLPARTSAISAAHLTAAAAGEGHEALHRCLGEMSAEEADWPAALSRLDAVGHCSGWDALAGVAAVVRAA